MSHLRSKTPLTASDCLLGSNVDSDSTNLQLHPPESTLSLSLSIPSSGVLPVPPPLLCSLPPPPAGAESSAAASARSCAELAEDAAAGLQAHGGRTELWQRRTRRRGYRWPTGATVPCFRLASLLDLSPRWIRVGRPRRQSEAVRGVLDLK